MPQVAMTIASRVYRVACDEGEEAHLGELAKLVDGKIADMREKFGEMGDQRLTVMAAVTLADELLESLRHVEELEAELCRRRGTTSRAPCAAAMRGSIASPFRLARRPHASRWWRRT